MNYLFFMGCVSSITSRNDTVQFGDFLDEVGIPELDEASMAFSLDRKADEDFLDTSNSRRNRRRRRTIRKTIQTDDEDPQPEPEPETDTPDPDDEPGATPLEELEELVADIILK